MQLEITAEFLVAMMDMEWAGENSRKLEAMVEEGKLTQPMADEVRALLMEKIDKADEVINEHISRARRPLVN